MTGTADLPSAPSASLAPPARDHPLDSLRGLDVLLMILVNVQGNGALAYPWIAHAEWTGVTPADFVFPLFLIIVGLSAPLALERPGAVWNWAAVLRRTALLFVLGIALSVLIRPTLDPAMVRITGVLQRIAIVYLICAAVIWARRGIGLAVALSVVLLAVQSWLLLRVGDPGSGSGPSMAPGEGISGWLDRHLIPGKLHRGTWEPEGGLSTLTAAVNGLIGVAAMRWMQARQPGNLALGAVSAGLVAAGLALTTWLPLNKNLWTASFALLTSGAGLAAWAALRASWPLLGASAVARWTVTLGQAALTLYVLHQLLIAAIFRELPNGDKIWAVTFLWLEGTTGLSPAAASMLYALLAAALCCAALPWLRRRGWLLRA